MSIDRRVLPTFLVLGTNKAGTGTLDTVLRRHPDVFLPFRKEVHFFNDDVNYGKGAAWYIETFYASSAGAVARGDITPSYLYFGDKVVPRIAEVYGDRPPRMVVILRDPVARAYSRYWHGRRLAVNEPLSFEDALAAEDERLAAEETGLLARGRFRYAYYRGGLYSEQLARYFDRFARDLFHIMLVDDLARDFDATVRALFTFLGVDATVPVLAVRSNAARAGRAAGVEQWIRSQSWLGRLVRPHLSPRMLSYARKALRAPFRTTSAYPPMDPATEAALRARYLPEIERLERLIDRDLSAWYPGGVRPRS